MNGFDDESDNDDDDNDGDDKDKHDDGGSAGGRRGCKTLPEANTCSSAFWYLSDALK